MRNGNGNGYFGALFFALFVMTASQAQASATCYCKISSVTLSGGSAVSVCMDLTNSVNHSYGGALQQSDSNQSDCVARCQSTSQSIGYGSQSVATSCCSIGSANGSPIKSFAAVGTRNYWPAANFGTLTNHPAVSTTTYTCPASWLANQTNVPGGVTVDGKCKKFAGTVTILPTPTGYTAIGTYGFMGGNAIYAWGTAANGGAPTATTTTTAAVCHF